jgi:hypothetical protein
MKTKVNTITSNNRIMTMVRDLTSDYGMIVTLASQGRADRAVSMFKEVTAVRDTNNIYDDMFTNGQGEFVCSEYPTMCRAAINARVAVAKWMKGN